MRDSKRKHHSLAARLRLLSVQHPSLKRTPKKRQTKGARFSLVVLFSLIVFVVFLVTMLVVVGIGTILIRTGVLQVMGDWASATRFLLYLGLASIILGFLLSGGWVNLPLQPINHMVNVINRLADGDYSARLDPGPVWSKLKPVDEVCSSINTLAEELGNTEMLRSDFVNNFSHEFKTPIVSIEGFAKLLQRGNLSKEEQQEYIGIIAEESARLAHMATNVLSLNKVEGHTILTDIKEFNLSELIRTSVLLLEPKWSKKDIIPDLDFDEYSIEGNEELLKQVFINLVDNAVKFSPAGGTVSIGIEEEEKNYTVTVTNNGPDIPAAECGRIFDKFYQADRSHATEGNGVGLAVVRQVTELHGGIVGVSSQNGTTTFLVTLPKKQGKAGSAA